MTIFNIRSLDSGTYVRRFLFFFATTKPPPYEVVKPQKVPSVSSNSNNKRNEMRMKQWTLRSFSIEHPFFKPENYRRFDVAQIVIFRESCGNDWKPSENSKNHDYLVAQIVIFRESCGNDWKPSENSKNHDYLVAQIVILRESCGNDWKPSWKLQKSWLLGGLNQF